MLRVLYKRVTFAAILFLAVVAVLPGHGAERLPYEYFAKNSDYGDVQISPDGKYYGIRFTQEDKQVLVFIRRKDMKMSGGASPLSDGSVNSFTWVNDERVVYEISRRDSYLDTPVGNGNLYAVNSDGSKHDIIFGFEAGLTGQSGSRLNRKTSTFADYVIVSTLPDDDKRILIAEYPYRQVGRIWTRDSRALTKVTRLNVYSGRKDRDDVLPMPSARALADNEGNVRVAIGADENADLVVQWKPDEDAEWQNFEMNEVGVNSAVPVSFSMDDQSVFISGQPEDGGPRAIYKLNLNSSSHALVYQNEVADVISGLYLRDLQDDSIVALYSEPDLPHYQYLTDNENRTVRLHKSLRAAFKGQDVRITSHTDDAEEVIVYVYSSVNPGEYYLFNTETNKAEFLFSRSSWVDPRKMRPQQPVTITARDGLQMPSYLTLPDDSGEPAPMVVMVHGGPHGPRDWWGYDSDAQFLANRGYAVLQVNYRGSGGFGPDYEIRGHGEWGGKMQDDLTDATLWAIQAGHADADRICIYGGSYGGYAALMGVAKEPDLYRCAIGYVGVYDLATMFEKGDIPEQRSGKGYLLKALGSDEARMRAHSPVHLADKIKAKVLLAHGGNDQRVPVAHAHMMREALEQAGNSPEWLLFEREGHGFFDVDHRIALYQKMESFLDKYIGGQSEGAQTSAE